MQIAYSLGANSSELDPDTKHPVVVNMPEISTTQLGGTMRLGSRETWFGANTDNSVIRRMYGGAEVVHERHRHRYEVNPDYVENLEASGLKFVGKDLKGERMSIFELAGIVLCN